MERVEDIIEDTEDSPSSIAEGVRWLGSLWLSAAMIIESKDCPVEDVQELQKFATDSLTQYILHAVGQEGLEVACSNTEEGLLAIKEMVETFNNNNAAKIVFDFSSGVPSFLKLHMMLSELSICNIGDGADIDFGKDAKTPSQIMYALTNRAASCNSDELRKITRTLSFLVGSSLVCEETFLIIYDAAHVWSNRVKSAAVEEKNTIASCLDVIYDNLQVMSNKMNVLGEAGLINKIKDVLFLRRKKSFNPAYDFVASALDGNKAAFRPVLCESEGGRDFLNVLKL